MPTCPPPPPPKVGATHALSMGRLEVVPLEVLAIIFGHLDGADLDCASCACRKMHHMAAHALRARGPMLDQYWRALQRELLPEAWHRRVWRGAPPPLVLAALRSSIEVEGLLHHLGRQEASGATRRTLRLHIGRPLRRLLSALRTLHVGGGSSSRQLSTALYLPTMSQWAPVEATPSAVLCQLYAFAAQYDWPPLSDHDREEVLARLVHEACRERYGLQCTSVSTTMPTTRRTCYNVPIDLEQNALLLCLCEPRPHHDERAGTRKVVLAFISSRDQARII